MTNCALSLRIALWEVLNFSISSSPQSRAFVALLRMSTALCKLIKFSNLTCELIYFSWIPWDKNNTGELVRSRTRVVNQTNYLRVRDLLSSRPVCQCRSGMASGVNERMWSVIKQIFRGSVAGCFNITLSFSCFPLPLSHSHLLHDDRVSDATTAPRDAVATKGKRNVQRVLYY